MINELKYTTKNKIVLFHDNNYEDPKGESNLEFPSLEVSKQATKPLDQLASNKDKL